MSKKHGNCIWKFNFLVSLLSLFVFGWLPRNPPFMFSKRFNYVSKKIRLRWSPFSLKTMLYHQLVWVRCLMLLAWGNSGSQFLKCQKMVEIGQQLILWSRKVSAYLFSEKKLENLNRIERISLIEKELQEMEWMNEYNRYSILYTQEM